MNAVQNKKTCRVGLQQSVAQLTPSPYGNAQEKQNRKEERALAFSAVSRPPPTNAASRNGGAVCHAPSLTPNSVAPVEDPPGRQAHALYCRRGASRGKANQGAAASFSFCEAAPARCEEALLSRLVHIRGAGWHANAGVVASFDRILKRDGRPRWVRLVRGKS